MTANQKQRARELIEELLAIKYAALATIEDLEPALAPPRSSLDPRNELPDHNHGADR